MIHKYISLEDYKIIENPNFFEVDEGIAEAISILNQKGYITSFSCEGHYKTEFLEGNEDSLDMLEEAKNNPQYIIRKVNGEKVEYASEIIGDTIYIQFREPYNFPFLPDDFEVLGEDNAHISYRMYYYDIDGNRKSREEFENDRKKHLKILTNWAKELPHLENDKTNR